MINTAFAMLAMIVCATLKDRMLPLNAAHEAHLPICADSPSMSEEKDNAAVILANLQDVLIF